MDWNDLPQDLVDLILSKLFGKDRNNFSLVCRSWNEAVEASPFRHSPCLMFYQRSKHLWRFFQHNKFFYMDFSKLGNATILSSNHGWLLMISRDGQKFFFYNPFDNRMIQLAPPLDMYTTVCFFHPPTSPDCFIVGIETENKYVVNIGVLKHGEDKWIRCPYQNKYNPFMVSRSQPIFDNGLVFFLDVHGNVSSFDIEEHVWGPCWGISVRCFKQRRLRRNIKEQFLIKPKGERKIYGVFTMHDDNRKVRVFKLSKEFSWELVEDLGDRVFYVSNMSSFGYTTTVKSMANKVFFPNFHGDSVVYYSLDTQKYHSFEGNYSGDNSYGLKRFDLATWTIPSSTDDASLAWCSQLNHTTT